MDRNSRQPTPPRPNAPTRSFSKRFSNLCMGLVSSNPRRQSSKPEPKYKISYPQQVQSSAPINTSPHRNNHRSRYHPTPAERRPLSDASFTCIGLGSDTCWEPEPEPGHIIEAGYSGLPEPSNTSSEWIAQPGTCLRTDELCKICDKQPVRDGSGICNRCKFYYNSRGEWRCCYVYIIC